MIEFSLHGSGRGVDPARLANQAVEAENAGFDAFYVPDHPGVTPAPTPWLSAAATVTRTIALGANVTNAGVREPSHIAVDVATLDLLSGGRAILGIGAGHTPAEWRAIGATRPSPTDRVARLIESADVIVRLLRGETVTHHSQHLRVDDATLTFPVPVQRRIPLLIGGGNRQLLDYAARNADIVGLAGLGRTLEDGHSHEVRWRPADTDRLTDIVHAAAGSRNVKPRVEALVQDVTVTDDRERAAAELVKEVPGLTVQDALECPYLLYGTESEITDQLLSHRRRWGIDRFAIRYSALEAITPVVAMIKSRRSNGAD